MRGPYPAKTIINNPILVSKQNPVARISGTGLDPDSTSGGEAPGKPRTRNAWPVFSDDSF